MVTQQTDKEVRLNGTSVPPPPPAPPGAMDPDEELPPPDLVFSDNLHQASTLSALNMMRKNRHFCDVVLHVGSAEVHAHRAVLASVSSYLFELFTTDQDNKRTENVITYKLNGGFDKNALQILVDYAYTSKLEVSYHEVKAVYLAACQLKMERVVKECAKHLIKNLSVDSCIEIRSLPGIARNQEFVQQVDAYIAKQFNTISQSPSVLKLMCTRIEVLNQSRQEMSLANHKSLCQLVLEWIKRQVAEEAVPAAALSEKLHMLYLAIDNSLQDCSSLPNGDVSDSDIVQDYKKMSLKSSQTNSAKAKRKNLSQPSKPRVLIYSRDIGECMETEFEPDWTVIATSKVVEHNFLALVTIAGKLSTLSIQLRLNTPSAGSPVLTPEASRPASQEKPDLYCVLANMANGRCAVGCANLEGNLLVCGGYDRIECLKTVELYNPESNTWQAMPSMREARGRFQIAVLGGRVFAIGGSNGTTELDTVEMLDSNAQKWSKVTRLPLARSNAGVCELSEIIYCVGGWNGQAGIKQCDVFHPEDNVWRSIAPLNIGRYQAGVTSFGSLVYAIGGCDSWNCLNSVEVYEPREDKWTFSKPIITARRGCGVAVFQDKLYAVGGSDGTHSLSSTEIYDHDSQSWVLGPSLTTPRANVGVTVVGNRLYAVGGFSGKTFLNTIEYLDANSKEWTTFIPKLCSVDILVGEDAEHWSDDNRSDSDDSTDKRIIGYNYNSNHIEIIDLKDMTKGTTEENATSKN